MTTPSKPTKVPGNVGMDDSGKYTPEQLAKLTSSSKQKDFDKQVIAWTKSAYAQCRTGRQFVERQWYVNLAFYSSRQNISTIPFSNGSSVSMGIRLYVPPAPYYRSRPVINKIRPIIRKEIARLTAQKPSATVVPATSEDRDMYAAQAGEQLWESMYRDKKINKVFKKAIFWALITGNGFVKQYWDAGKPSGYSSPVAVVKKDPMGNPMTEIPGDICYENVTPFNLFFPNLLVDDIEAQPYIIHIQTRSPDWIKLNYGISVAPDSMEASDILNDSFLNLIGAGAMNKDKVLVYEVWIKPKQVTFLPEGGMFTIVGNQLIQIVKSNPYLHQQYPFTQIPYIDTGRFYADSVINDLVPIQREYNRTRGQIIENKNKMGAVKLIAQEGSIDPSKITSEPGQAIIFKLGYQPPTPVPPVPLPNYVLQEVDRLNQEFEDISGQHEVSKGQAPPGVTAATAISFLQEQDESMLSSAFQGIEDAYEKVAFQTLNLIKQYWTIPRMVKVAGTNNQFSVVAFRGSDLRDNTDIRIEAGSALPTSKAGKQALLMDLMTQGFIPPEKGLELMDIGGVQRLYDQLKIDSSQASRENLKMAAVSPMDLMLYQQASMPGGLGEGLGTSQGMFQEPSTSGLPGQPGIPDPNNLPPDMPPEMVQQAMGNAIAPPLIVPVNSWDNHMVHVQVHNDYRKSQEFEQLAPEQKQLFEDHVNQHLMSMGMSPGATPEAQATQQQQMMQMNAGPVPMPNPNKEPSGGTVSQSPGPDANLNQPPMGG